jgi:mannan endo-1,4-beta-mannosidase
MRISRPLWPLLAGAAVTLALSGCSVVSRAAYPYWPAGPPRLTPIAGSSALAGSALAGIPGQAGTPPGPLPVRTASYWGVFEPGVPASYLPVQQLTGLMQGTAPRIVLYFSSWGQPFETAFAAAAYDHSALPLVQIQPSGISLAGIAAGDFDGYLRSYAQEVRAYGRPVIIGFAHEMNGPWYSWGYGKVAASTWVAAWRHVVTVFRQQQADNVTWLWTANITAPGIPSPRAWWPGAAYVTWIGIDGYYFSPDDSFGGVFGPTIADVRSFTGQPILIAETGIAPSAVPQDMPGLIDGIRQDRLLGLVWFDSGGSHDWRLEGHPAALAAFRLGITRMLTQDG